MDVKRRDVLKGAAAATAAAAVSSAAIIAPTPSYAQQVDAAKKWVDSEFQPSTLSKDEQMAEMEWFIKASAPFKGMEVSTVSEILSVHDYESKMLTKAFAEITGIKVNHELMNEGLLVSKIAVEIASGKPIYDFWMNDSDHIGTHPRFNDIIDGSLTDFMAGDAKDITSPTLDLKDFIGLDFATYVDGKIYGLPDQQFANLYWFRYDWFQRPEIKAAFKAKYGYDLGVPVNWSAYEDIADYLHQRGEGNRRPESLWPHGLRQEGSLARLALHRRLAVDGGQRRQGSAERQAGRRMGHPPGERHVRVGSSLSRGGDANGPAAVYATTKFVEWLKKYAPPEAVGHGLPRSRRGAGPGPYRAAGLLVQRVHPCARPCRICRS